MVSKRILNLCWEGFHVPSAIATDYILKQSHKFDIMKVLNIKTGGIDICVNLSVDTGRHVGIIRSTNHTKPLLYCNESLRKHIFSFFISYIVIHNHILTNPPIRRCDNIVKSCQLKCIKETNNFIKIASYKTLHTMKLKQHNEKYKTSDNLCWDRIS